MEPEHVQTVLISSSLIWALGATVNVLRRGKTDAWLSAIHAAVSLVVLVAALSLAALLWPQRSSLGYLFRVLRDHELQHLAAAGLGLSAGSVLALWTWEIRWSRRTPGIVSKVARMVGLLAVLTGYAMGSVFVSVRQIKTYLNFRQPSRAVSSPVAWHVEEKFVIEEYHECTFAPIQIVVGPDGHLYAVGVEVNSPWDRGLVVRLVEDPITRTVSETRIAYLNRPYGLAFHGTDLYVSRSGQHTRADSGKLTPVNTGCVTLLRDLDGDGIMDFYHDVLQDLPGSWLSGGLHQNNGIAFGPDGHLYTTVGSPGYTLPTVQPFEGTILRSKPDGSDCAVFARGLRNPFDLVFGPDGQLFCTDNDATGGDELNHIMPGLHYGFPYADGATPHATGTVAPLLVSRNGTFQGIAWTSSTALPRKYRNCLYIANYGPGQIIRVRLHKDAGTFRVEQFPFAVIPGALDVTIDPQGSFYISCFESKKIYRIKYEGER